MKVLKFITVTVVSLGILTSAWPVLAGDQFGYEPNPDRLNAPTVDIGVTGKDQADRPARPTFITNFFRFLQRLFPFGVDVSKPRAADPDAIQTCLPRPACLDAPRFRCLLPEPEGGWCSNTSVRPTVYPAETPTPLPHPTCQVPPPCVYGNPRCLLPEPVAGWCPSPSVTPVASPYCDRLQNPHGCLPEIERLPPVTPLVSPGCGIRPLCPAVVGCRYVPPFVSTDGCPTCGTQVCNPAQSTQLSIQTVPTLMKAWQGIAYRASISVQGGMAGEYRWQVSSFFSRLPPGLSLIPAGDSAVIAGTPTRKGNYTFSVKVTSGKESVSRRFNLSVN